MATNMLHCRKAHGLNLVREHPKPTADEHHNSTTFGQRPLPKTNRMDLKISCVITHQTEPNKQNNMNDNHDAKAAHPNRDSMKITYDKHITGKN